MLKEFLMKKMLQAKLKDIPQAEQDKMLSIITKNPDFFMKIAQEIQEKMKSGKDQLGASMEVMKNHEAEIKELMK